MDPSLVHEYLHLILEEPEMLVTGASGGALGTRAYLPGVLVLLNMKS